MQKGVSSTKGSLFIVSAPSGAGKTTLCKELCKSMPRLKHSVSYTTRLRRKGERDKVHYYFVSRAEFRKMIEKGEFAEWAVVYGNFYGTSIRNIEELKCRGYDIILDIDIHGAMQMKQKYKEAVYVFILPPSIKVLQKRLRDRMSDSDDTIKERLAEARDEMRNYRNYDFVIVNDDIKSALLELESIVRASRARTEKIDQILIGKLLK
ncbi:MAG: guanylate kinase [Nitrospirae bacterium]|nr:guanylate kinase [Nitrospirota bacterium]